MMNQLLETVFQSIQELLADGIKIIPALLIAIIIIFLTRYTAEFVRRISERIGRRILKSKSLQLLFRQSSYVFTWVIGVFIACVVAFPGLRLGDLIAALGLTSVAIGFAFQDIFKNFLAGILLLIQEPFRISDQIVVDDYEGTVEHIDIRTTAIRSYTGELVLLPNSTVFTSAVVVKTAFDSRRTDLEVGVDYGTSLPKAAKILEQVITKVEGVLEDPAPEIDLLGFGDSSINFAVRYWTLPQMREVRHAQTKAIFDIKEAFDKADINIPYPIRTLYFYNQDKYDDYLPTSNNTNDK